MLFLALCLSTLQEITGSFEKIEEKHARIFTRLDQHAVKLWGVRDSVEGGTIHGIQAAQKASTDRLGKVESKIEALESGHTDVDQRLKGIVEDKTHEFCTLSELLKSIRCLEWDTTDKQLTHDEDTSSDRLELKNEIEERPTETGLMDYTSSLESVKETAHCLQGSLALTHRDLMYDMAEVRQRLQKLESTGAPSSGDVYKRINELNRELVLRQEFDKSFEELCAMFFDAMEQVANPPPCCAFGYIDTVQSGKNFVLLKTLIDENQARTSFLYRELGLKTTAPVAGVKG
jgi:antirestriction protein